jgi:tyrosyl-tRNA synthetase
MSKVITDEAQIEKVLTRGVENVYPDKKTLKTLLMSGKQITLYCGYDPTASTLHIGHGITIAKLAQFQELGHKVIFLFGDFTGQIGDPDKESAREQINHKQVLENLKDWKNQIKNIIDIKKIEFKFNSNWLSKLSFTDLIKIAQNFTVQQMLERDMFDKRIKGGKPVYLHEFFYPLMQAYDSVAMDVDLEVGGNDQTFNMLAGRTLMKAMKKKEKFVLTTKILADPTGKKMGKSEGNMVTLVDKPADMYGKVMSWSDGMILPAFELLTEVSEDTLRDMENEMKLDKVNPRDLKMKLAKEIVQVYLGDEAAESAEEDFKRVFQDGQKPMEMKLVKIEEDKIGVLDLFTKAGMASSNGEVRRLIKEGAIRIDDQKVTNEKIDVEIKDGMTLQRGKKQFAKIIK